ncbi:recombinase family protein [Heliobacterium chlorum]|uniref:Recombinase family protein n=1 Tax=Heliobacterium chlorum TaxID=2698 RepID=A0ABR7T1T0_HELCL|nr:recombinase family protein [Heliobacterium chlorum]MBC9783486.1 recombinase family protein [Heliobacterium chlorum]
MPVAAVSSKTLPPLVDTRETALYVRVSDDEQAEEGYSIPEQTDFLIQWAHLQKIKNFKVYVDDGYTGKNMNRPDFQKILHGIESGSIGMVVTKKLNRLSRNLIDTLWFVLELCVNHNCRYKSATEDHDTSTPSGLAFFQIMATFAEYTSNQISYDVKATMTKIFEDDPRRSLGQTAFGFASNDEKLLVINEREAATIRKMWEFYAEGYGYRGVAMRLNDLTPDEFAGRRNGQPWQSEIVKAMINNPIYIGKRLRNQRYKDRHGKGYYRPMEEWVFKDLPEELIIIKDEEVAQKVLQRLGIKKKVGRKTAGKSIFSGLLVCGHCGSKMYSWNRFGKRSYICGNYRVSGGCFCHWINQDTLIEKLDTEMKFLPDMIRSNPEKTIVNASTKNDQKRRNLEAELAKVEGKFHRQWEAYQAGVVSLEQLQKAKAAAEKEKECLRKEIDSMDIEKPVTKQEILNALQNSYEQFRKALEMQPSDGYAEVVNVALKKFLKSIEIRDKEIHSLSFQSISI